MTITITLSQIRAKGACSEQLKLFDETFGAFVTFDTREAFVAACQAHPFDYGWAATYLLDTAALADYARVRAPALAGYDRAVDAARAGYDRAAAAAWADYDRATAAALADYDRATAAALADYVRAKAAAFANAYWTQENPQ